MNRSIKMIWLAVAMAQLMTLTLVGLLLAWYIGGAHDASALRQPTPLPRQTGVAPGTSHVRPIRRARSVPRDPARTMPADGPYLHTDGGVIRDARGNPVRLSGVNWFGLETCTFAPGGLGNRSWWDLLDQVRALGYNTIRLPFSDQLVEQQNPPQYINYDLNPDLRGLSGLQIMDRLIAGAGARGLRIVLDRHRADCTAQSPLWYTADVSQAQWIRDLVFLAHRYRNQPAVIGLDLYNEPQFSATWGDGKPATDWRLAAEQAGNAVLRVNPHWLIFVQGITTYKGDAYWWGGNLEGAATAPVRLIVPHRLVYEAHDYGPSLYAQGWFAAPDFPRNLPAVWDAHWGYLAEQGIAPVLVGEFGGRTVAPDASPARTSRGKRDPTVQDGIWQRSLVQYLAQHRSMSFMYWSLTPDSQDTGGLLNDDWQTASPAKQELLRAVQGKAIPLPHSQSAQAAVRLLVADALSADSREQALTLKVINDSARPLDLSGAVVRYWLDASPGGSVPATATTELRTASVDWSSMGPNTVNVATGAARGRVYLDFQVQAQPGATTTVAPYGGTAQVTLRLFRPDWTAYSPAADWSYLASTVPVPAPHVTLALAGDLVWGTTPPSPLPPPAVPARPAQYYRHYARAE
jgi:endoglucanase